MIDRGSLCLGGFGRRERPAAAEALFEQAKLVGVNAYQRAFFSSLVLRQKLLSGEGDEGLLAELRGQINALSGDPASFPFVREYVILLHRLGRDAEAVVTVENELGSIAAGYTREERAELLLLKGSFSGLSRRQAGRL